MEARLWEDYETEALQWGRNFIVAEIHDMKVPIVGDSALQWGRNFIVAEIHLQHLLMPLCMAASMGPQLYRCGNMTKTYVAYCAICSASMGPQLYRCGNAELLSGTAIAKTLQWGRNFIVAEITERHCTKRSTINASMGPQLYRCGNESTPCPPCPVRVMLQWGRNFIVAETMLRY